MNRTLATAVLAWSVVTCGAARPAHALSPPQYTLWNKVKGSVGATPGVKVGDLVEQKDGRYTASVVVKRHDQAVAVASVLKLSHKIGNLTVEFQVTDGDGAAVKPLTPKSAGELADLVRMALSGNPFLKEVVVKGGLGGPTVYPVFTKSVIQFPDDDLSDLYGNFNGVAAEVFGDTMLREAGKFVVSPSTTK